MAVASSRIGAPRRGAILVSAVFVFASIQSMLPTGASAAPIYDNALSTSPNRSNPVSLDGQTVSGDIYVFVTPQTGVTRVRFFVDNPTMSGTPTKVENAGPWDLAGTNSDGTARPYNTALLANGTHTLTTEVTLSAGGTEIDSSTFTVSNGGGSNPYQLMLSTAPDRSNPVVLEGQSVSGNIYVFTTPTTSVTRVRFWLDNPNMTGTPTKTENGAPFDFAGTNGDGTAKPYDTSTLPDGAHSITASVEVGTTAQIVTDSFTVDNSGADRLVWADDAISFTADSGGGAPNQVVNLDTNDGSTASFTLSESASWLTVTPLTQTTPRNITFSVDGSSLTPGTHSTTVVASASGYISDSIDVSIEVGGGCSPLACSEVLVDLPYELDWGFAHGKILDANGVGTGFTWVDDPTNGTGYIPANLNVDLSAGHLEITTTRGLAYQSTNSQDNALAVGIDAPSQTTLIGTTLVDPPAGTGNNQQAGLWFGNDEDNFSKLVVVSSPTGTRIQFATEIDGSQTGATSVLAGDLTSSNVFLQFTANPTDRTMTAHYSINGGALQQLGQPRVVPLEFFSFDAAGIDPEIGTNSFGGIYASHRKGPAPLVYTFDQFTVQAEDGGEPPIETGGFTFDRTSFFMQKPTSMAWGPDGRLYVTEFLGEIHALTLDSNHQVIGDQSITTLGQRLTLGLTIDPDSTPSNVILWVSHSSPSLNNGEPNSSVVTRLSGPGFTTRQDVITGLPRAIANHAINSLHFGPDGRLYIAQGGNTGAGAPNDAQTEFGDMEEQPLSAALLVADVDAAGFDGSCNNEQDIFGPPPCDVQVYASGLRNTYDFVFHSNGQIYGPDNGLGVTGTFPPSPTPPCFGFGDTTSWSQGGDNPGEQPDNFNRIVQGRYYGHPNPYRNECVFRDGRYQGVPADPDYMAPMHNLGNNRSANGTIEYLNGDTFCGDLQGQVLLTNYSIGDDVTRLQLSSNGLSVIDAESLVGGFDDPLPITEDPDGNLYVGEFGGNLITVLEPLGTGCWSNEDPLPVATLDAGGAALGGKIYVVAGKNGAGTFSTTRIYNPATGAWTTGPNLPGPAVENPAVTTANGLLYAFGGSTQPFSGAVTNAAVYDPSTNQWTPLAAMPVARGGATAQAIGNLIYVVGGMDTDGASLDTVSVFNINTGTWSSVASMSTRRDNPGSAVLNGDLYIFGGRTRNADGTIVANTLNTVEMFDPGTGTWTSRAPMPTGRRTMVVGVLNGRALVIGGERKVDGTAFSENEEYDPDTNTWRTLKPLPTARHGAVAGVVNGVVYVIGGATSASAGTAVTNNEAFSFQS